VDVALGKNHTPHFQSITIGFRWTRTDLSQTAQSARMSDALDDTQFWARQLLHRSKLEPLRSKMQAVIAEHEATAKLSERRRSTVRGRDLSDIVIDGRDERL
jgi:hypothetical protein